MHYRVEYPPQSATAEASNIAAVHCYHGFGANTFSWSFTQVGIAVTCTNALATFGHASQLRC